MVSLLVPLYLVYFPASHPVPRDGYPLSPLPHLSPAFPGFASLTRFLSSIPTPFPQPAFTERLLANKKARSSYPAGFQLFRPSSVADPGKVCVALSFMPARTSSTSLLLKPPGSSTAPPPALSSFHPQPFHPAKAAESLPSPTSAWHQFPSFTRNPASAPRGPAYPPAPA